MRILIRRIHVFKGLSDPHPDPLVLSTAPDPDPSLFLIKVLSGANSGRRFMTASEDRLILREDFPLHCSRSSSLFFRTECPENSFFFLYLFGGLECRPLLCLCRPFCIFERYLDSNPERCRSNQARYQLSHPSPYITHPSPYLATHLPSEPLISLKIPYLFGLKNRSCWSNWKFKFFVHKKPVSESTTGFEFSKKHGCGSGFSEFVPTTLLFCSSSKQARACRLYE